MTSISKSTSPLKRFHCAQCSKTYTKLEHLTRHERTHTNTKPFQCKHCGRSFGRQDVLGRHMKLHADTSTPTPTPPQTAPVPDTPQSTANGNNHGELTGSSMHIDECMSIDPFGHQSTLEMDSDGLLEWLMPDFHMASVVPLPFTDLPSAAPVQGNPSEATIADIAPHRASGGEKTAIHQIYTLIEDLSKRLHSDLHNTGITSAFLDACLHEFFNRVSPSFPVLHEPTFSTRETIPPLLLNIVALGSLFVCLPDSVQKGEILWRLGHTAVATSWQTLIGLRGPRDECDGVQVVLTALLGQTYALLSSNTHIRMTALVFHGLGFYWARTCGMYAVKDIRADEIPDPVHASESEKETAWKNWSACEVQRRAILGHYILDGLISQASGSPASARHLINSISSTCSDSAFSAKTANEWIVEMKQSVTETVQKPLSEIFVALFSDTYTSTPMQLSNFSLPCIRYRFQEADYPRST
ncbi:hypothetical protein MW887_005933 [Aspergillus wentii]|nr:hypothetical protein MW887_005933 [Aspergillus wentii]